MSKQGRGGKDSCTSQSGNEGKEKDKKQNEYEVLKQRFVTLLSNMLHLSADFEKLKKDYCTLEANRQMMVDLIMAASKSDKCEKHSLVVDLRKPKLENPASEYSITNEEQQQNLELIQRAYSSGCIAADVYEELDMSISSFLEYPLYVFKILIETYVTVMRLTCLGTEVKERLKGCQSRTPRSKCVYQNLLKFVRKQKAKKIESFQNILEDINYKKQQLLRDQLKVFVKIIHENGVLVHIPQLVKCKPKFIPEDNVCQQEFDNIVKLGALSILKVCKDFSNSEPASNPCPTASCQRQGLCNRSGNASNLENTASRWSSLKNAFRRGAQRPQAAAAEGMYDDGYDVWDYAEPMSYEGAESWSSRASFQ